MISPALLALVRCPACRGPLAPGTAPGDAPGASPGASPGHAPGHYGHSCGAETATCSIRRRRATTWTCGRTKPSKSGRSTWMKRSTPTRVTSACRRRCWGRRSATTCCASSSRRARRSRRGSRLRERTRAVMEPRVARLTGVDISPFFAHEVAPAVDLLLGDLRRLPFADGTFTKGYSLDVLEHLSPEALRGDAGRGGARHRAGRRVVRLYPRPQERADRHGAARGSTRSPAASNVWA